MDGPFVFSMMPNPDGRAHQLPSTPASSTFKSKRLISCVLCQQRKVKCDKKSPCSACTKAGVTCVAATAQPPRRRKRSAPEETLLARLKRYEALLKNHGVDVESGGPEDAQSESGDDVDVALPDAPSAEGSKASGQENSKIEGDKTPWGKESGRLITEQSMSRYLEK